MAHVQVIVQHYGAVQPSPGLSGLHQDSRPLVQLATVLEKSSQQKQTTLLRPTVTVKFDSTFIKLCVCVKKSNFLSWAIRTVFADSVTYLSEQFACGLVYSIVREIIL